MAKQHGRHTILTIDGDDISTHTNTSEIEETADSHDTTGYGASGHAKAGGLKDGKFSCGGVYEVLATVTSPVAVIPPLIGTVVVVTRKLEGTGTGKPLETVSVLITKYVDTAPVADMVTWSCEGEVSGTIARTTQA